MSRTCPDCLKAFIEPDEWKHTCVVCWKKSKGHDLGLADKAYIRLQDYLEEVSTDLGVARGEIKKLVAASAVEQKIDLTQDQIKALLKLCHPDRHKGSVLSNEVTKWLLGLRST